MTHETTDYQANSRRSMAGDSSNPRQGEGTGNKRKAASTVQEGARWDTVHSQDGMPVEGSTKRIWLWIDMSQEVPEVGERRSLPKDMDQAPEEV